MNLVLFGIAIFLLTQRRTIVIDSAQGRSTLPPELVPLRTVLDCVEFRRDREYLTLSIDQVFSGFAIGGSTAAQTFSRAGITAFYVAER